jgi:DNA phosphorothioation-dependent restriction protein DptG
MTNYTTLLREYRDVITHIWADEVFASSETRYAQSLSYRQLIDHLPGLLDEIGRVLDRLASPVEIAEAARRIRYFIHIRFQQGCLIDEVARELSALRQVINDFIWRETLAPTERDLRGLRSSLKRADIFFDELMRQMIVVYAASLRPPVATYASIWHPGRSHGKPQRRSTDTPQSD